MVPMLPAYAVEKLTLRVNDAEAVPGGTVAIVLRTYASKPIEQGQLCLEAKPTVSASSGPAKRAQSAEVFSDNQDTESVFAANLTQAVQTFVIEFSSPTATINSSDGPLAVFLVDLDDNLIPGQTFDLEIDPQNTFVFDENGNPIVIRPRGGTLFIRDPSDPISLGVEADDVVPGGVARLSLQTRERIPLAYGRVGLVYNRAIAAGPPTVSVDPRYGRATFTLDTSVPGFTVIHFTSTDGSLNSIPGSVIDIHLPTRDTISADTLSPISLDASAFLVDTTGRSLALSLESDVLHFVAPTSFAPGNVVNLRLDKGASSMIELDWSEACGDPDGFSIYRGDLAVGLSSLSPEPGACNTYGTTALLPMGGAAGELFLIVAQRELLAGGYGVGSGQVSRAPIFNACYPPAPGPTTNACQPTEP